MSTARASTARSRASGPVAPTYEPMEFTLTAKAQRELALISRQHDLKDVNAHLQTAQLALTDYAADINEKAYWKEHELQKRQRQSQNRRKKIKTQHGHDDNENDGAEADTEANLAELRKLEARNADFKSKVQAMTRRMDENIRKAIDGAQSIEELKECLELATSSAIQNSQRIQIAQSQAAARDAEEDNEDEEDVTQVTATGRSRTARERDATIELGPEPTKTLRERLERSAHKYQSLSLANRYSEHPIYVGFKQTVHEAQHDPENIPDLPPARTWFASSKSEPVPGMTRTADGDDDEDDDVAVLQAKVSTKCPLTLVEFVDPVTSSACRHSFERSAIEEMIHRSIQRQHGRTGEKIVQCPVPGCNARISKQDLRKDVAILRKIQRIQEHQRRAKDYEDDGGPKKSGPVEIGSDEDEDDGGHDIDDLMGEDERAARRRTIQRFKSEPRGTQGRGRQDTAAARSHVPAVVDLDGESADEDETEEIEDD